jgi:hypothetical protein
LAVIVVAVWALNDSNGLDSLLRLIELGGGSEGLSATAAALLITGGLVAAAISFLGCCGALKVRKRGISFAYDNFKI